MAPYRLLLIEDDTLVLDLLTQGLAPEFACVACPDGQGAAARARAEQPAAVVLDLRLRGADGLAVLAELRRHPATAALPVVIFSSIADQPGLTQRIAKVAGAAPVLRVPKSAGVRGLRAALTACLHPATHASEGSRGG
jgi:two-component system response regulator FitH